MRKILTWAALCLIGASVATAAEIFGTVSENGKPLPEGVGLKLVCGDASVSGATDRFGSYSLKTTATGECHLTATYKGASPSLKVTLYEKPSRYDLVVKQEAGKVTLARK